MREPLRRQAHGIEWIDEYAWLAERGSARVVDYLEAENRYAEAELRRTEALRRTLYEEFVGRICHTDVSVPVPFGAHQYYRRTEKGLQYPIWCRRRPQSGEEILLDPNVLVPGGEYLRVGAVRVSPNHRFLAFCLDTGGGESFGLFVRDLQTGDLVEEGIEGISAEICWASDSRTLFYATLDAANRPYRVYRHRLGKWGDTEVFREDDEAFFVSLRTSRDGALVLLTSASNVTTEVRYLPADRPDAEPLLVEPRRAGVEYSVGHHEGSLYLRTNDRATNFRLVERPLGGSGADEREIVAHQPEVRLGRVDLFSRRMVVEERRAGLQRLRVLSYDGEVDDDIPLPESVYSLRREWNPEASASSFRFAYTSLVTPLTVFSYSFETRELETLKVQEVRGGYEAERYVTTRTTATAPDGVQVPVSLVHRRDLRLDGSPPCLLHGYGAYGTTLDPAFSAADISLLDRGFVVAVAHVRGGGLLGERWHEDGRTLSKRNSFSDFVAAAEMLCAAGYTSPRRLAARGASAGGLLIGAVLNLRPELFGAAVAHVPFVDVVQTMLDATIPLTVIEYEEWGNPNDREYFDYMRSYSPYDNVTRQGYPAVLVTAGLNDPRVQYWEPAKWVARLRRLKTDDAPLVLRTHMSAGHGGPSGRYEALRERALEYAFVIDAVDTSAGISPPG